MIKIVIIEDEISGQEVLKKYIHDHFAECKIEAVIDHVQKAVSHIPLLKPDLVFIDVHIKGGTGFDVLKYFPDREFEVIFVTAYDTYAIQAIKEEALDYILKPVNSGEFKKGVAKALERIKKKALSSRSPFLSIATYSGTEFINYEEIIFLEAEGAYTTIVLADSKIVSTKNIGEYEPLLTDHSFFRTHHSFIVNIKQIEKFNKGRSGILRMKTGHSIPVSQRKMREFNDLLKQINL